MINVMLCVNNYTMGNEISLQLRLNNTTTKPVTFNKSMRSPTKLCQSSQKSNQASLIEQVDPKDCVAPTKDGNIEQGLFDFSDQSNPTPAFFEIREEMTKSGTEVLAIRHLEAERDEEGKDLQTKFVSSNYGIEYEKKLKGIRQTLRSLDDSLHETRSLDTEKSFRYSQLKTKNMSLQIDLEKAKKRNKNMLNLFRQNAAEIGFGRLRTSSTLPESLRKDVQRIWSQKYDVLLERNNQLKKEAVVAEFALKDKNRQIEDLQQRLLNLAEDLIQREKTIENICTKFISLKKRKDEQEVLLKGSVETLQDALRKVRANVASSKSEISMFPSKDALIAREVRRSDRLAYENSLLRTLLREAKRNCMSSRTASTISLREKKF